MTALRIRDLDKRFGDVAAVDGVSFDVESGTLVSLLGPSGCGKSTILRMIAGLIEPDAGSIRIGDAEVTWLPPHRRNIGLVFQSYALFPHMSVYENVAFGLRQRRLPEDAASARIAETLAMVRPEGLERRLPRELSGGQQQRVALARAIAPRPALLLLDEPLSNLDAKLRDVMRVELRRLQQDLAITTVFVTHDQEEALTMSDRICVLSAGRLQQIGAPREVYDRPATPFVADFFGRSNGFDGVVAVTGQPSRVAVDGGLDVAVASLPEGVGAGGRLRLTVRQESIAVSDTRLDGLDNSFAGTLVLASFAGSTVQYVIRLSDGVELIAESRADRGRPLPAPGSPVHVGFAAGDVIAMRAA